MSDNEKSDKKKSDNDKENPRTSRVRKIMLDAAIELLVDKGPGEVTATRVAKKTGVARTTIYRQWPDQASLVLATIEAMVQPHADHPDTGDLEVDLAKSLSLLRTRVEYQKVRPVFAALSDYATRDEAFVVAQRRFLQGLVSQTVGVLDDAKERGDLPAGFDSTTSAAMLAGPLLYQHLLVLEKISDGLIDEIVSQFVRSHA